MSSKRGMALAGRKPTFSERRVNPSSGHAPVQQAAIARAVITWHLTPGRQGQENPGPKFYFGPLTYDVLPNTLSINQRRGGQPRLPIPSARR
ncbi:hypothetical protein PUN4_310013 [Paraburkholderia unamae]|nr:hypothetical protein PUN4_310013 [Paraburkholderia unamae]